MTLIIYLKKFVFFDKQVQYFSLTCLFTQMPAGRVSSVGILWHSITFYLKSVNKELLIKRGADLRVLCTILLHYKLVSLLNLVEKVHYNYLLINVLSL